MGRRFAAIGVGVISAAVLGAGVASASTSWVIQSTPNPAGATSSILNGVSCPSTTACTAVGTSSNVLGAGLKVTLAERWNGTRWAIQSTPKPTGATDSRLNGVSCPSTTACTAVGSYRNSSGVDVTLAERWNGTSWAIQSTPNPTGETALNGVSCPSTTACTAVGGYTNSSGVGVTLAERWNGTRWAIQSTPNLIGGMGTDLIGVSCPSTTACTAVGMHTNTSDLDVALAERWNGTGWAIQSTPNSTISDLNGVSCRSNTACTAVGTYENDGGPQVTLAERWNGTRWAIQSTPNLTGAALNGVSCPSTTACTAVGTSSSGGFVTLAERWNGTRWAIQSTPNPTGALVSDLNGVSCPSTTACTTVGTYTNSSGVDVTLAERWHSTS